jgi:hypothetical protein
MHTDTIQKEKPTGSANFPAGHTDSRIVADDLGIDKAFITLRAQFALHGHTLHRTSLNDGSISYPTERWGLVRYLHTLDGARRFLVQIGGKP